MSDIVPVILSGGSGSRLWPVSRESFPKQFWPLVSERTMIQETAARALGEGFAAPVIVTNEAHRFVVAEQMRAMGIEGARVVLEPIGRNSAPAILAAALIVAETNPDAVLWMMAADHSIADVPALHACLAQAALAARAGHIVTFGMRPTSADTGLGYIEMGGALAFPGVSKVAKFVEKPNAATAEAFLAGGRHLWNSGMFVFTAATLIAEMERFEPEVVQAIRASVAARATDLDFIRLGADDFRACKGISIDYAVAERTDKAAVVPADIGWTDVGNWAALWDIAPKDAHGNAALGDVLIEDARDCYIRTDGITTAVVGLQDVVVVVTEDAVLAMHRDRAQDVKKIIDRLKSAKREEGTSHNRVYRPWGFYESLIVGDRFQVKRIVVKPGAELSLQKHFHRSEHWVVVQGTAMVVRDAEKLMLRENESVYLPLGTVHRLENPGRIPLTLIEVQSGSYLGEDDIVRLEDTYGRH